MSKNVEVERPWTRVCALEDILPDTGVCGLVGREQVAVFRVGESSEVYAIGNFDPFSKANVLSRGIVGDRGGRLKVASPIYKQNFALDTGECLDDSDCPEPSPVACLFSVEKARWACVPLVCTK